MTPLLLVAIVMAIGGVVYLVIAEKRGYFRKGFKPGPERWRDLFVWFGLMYALVGSAILWASVSSGTKVGH